MNFSTNQNENLIITLDKSKTFTSVTWKDGNATLYFFWIDIIFITKKKKKTTKNEQIKKKQNKNNLFI